MLKARVMLEIHSYRRETETRHHICKCTLSKWTVNKSLWRQLFGHMMLLTRIMSLARQKGNVLVQI